MWQLTLGVRCGAARWAVAIGCGGLGGGFVFGGEAIDSIVILNTKIAVRAFMGKGQVTLGGNVSLAVGPVGRDIEAHVGASNRGQLVAAYSYSQAQGAYIGGTLEGAIMMIRNDENRKFYGSPEYAATRAARRARAAAAAADTQRARTQPQCHGGKHFVRQVSLPARAARHAGHGTRRHCGAQRHVRRP